jgi:hypothetical protein
LVQLLIKYSFAVIYHKVFNPEDFEDVLYCTVLYWSCFDLGDLIVRAIVGPKDKAKL